MRRPPFFYGWLLVACRFVTMAVGVNARTTFSLLFPAILDEFHWDRGVTAGAFSFGFLVSALVTPFVGRLMDCAGPRLVVEIGVVTMGAGLILATCQPSRGSFISRWARSPAAASTASPIPGSRCI